MLTPLAITLGGMCLLLLTTPHEVSIYDEGLILTGARRVLHGELPWRDFFANYGPAQFLLAAGAFSVFGFGMGVARVLDSLILCVAPLLTWLILSPLVRTPVAWAAVAASAAVLFAARAPLYPLVPAMELSLLAAWVLIRRLAARQGWAPAWPVSVLLAGVTAFRFDLGLTVACFLGAAAVAVLVWQVRAGVVERAAPARFAATNVLALLAVHAVVAGVLAFAGMLQPAIGDIRTIAAANYVAMRNLPFPGWATLAAQPTEVLVYLVPAAIGFAAWVAVRRLGRLPRPERNTAAADERWVALIVLTALSVALFTKGLVRTSSVHMLAGNVSAVLVLAIAGDALLAKGGYRHGQSGRKLVLAALLLPALVLDGASIRANTSAWMVAEGRGENPWPLSLDDERLAAARRVRELTHSGERILSATGRHDKLFVNDIALYALTDRLPATRWHHYEPGVQTTEPVQRQIVSDLERGVRVVVRDRSFDGAHESNRSAISSGVTILDRYLDERFTVESSFGPIDILVRRP